MMIAFRVLLGGALLQLAALASAGTCGDDFDGNCFNANLVPDSQECVTCNTIDCCRRWNCEDPGDNLVVDYQMAPSNICLATGVFFQVGISGLPAGFDVDYHVLRNAADPLYPDNNGFTTWRLDPGVVDYLRVGVSAESGGFCGLITVSFVPNCATCGQDFLETCPEDGTQIPAPDTKECVRSSCDASECCVAPTCADLGNAEPLDLTVTTPQLASGQICLASGALFQFEISGVPAGFNIWGVILLPGGNFVVPGFNGIVEAQLDPGMQTALHAFLQASATGEVCVPVTLDFTPECACDLQDPNACPSDNPSIRCCTDTQYCDVPSAGACGDPHMTGFLGQKFDFTGEDGEWYALIADDNMNINMRVTSPVPELPVITYITGLSVLTADADGFDHSIVIEVKDPHSLESACPAGVSPCLADGALRVTLDGAEALLAPGTVYLGQDVQVSAVNLPGQCRSFGFEKYWEQKVLEYEAARHDRRLGEFISMSEWVLGDPTATNMPECIEYVAQAELEDDGLFAHQSEHASFQIVTPKATIRLSHGRLHQLAMRDPTDQFDLPDHLTWQMNMAVDHNEVSRDAKGILGETRVPTRDHEGKPVMQGMEAIRGQQEDYLVDGALGMDFRQGRVNLS